MIVFALEMIAVCDFEHAASFGVERVSNPLSSNSHILCEIGIILANDRGVIKSRPKDWFAQAKRFVDEHARAARSDTAPEISHIARGDANGVVCKRCGTVSEFAIARFRHVAT